MDNNTYLEGHVTDRGELARDLRGKPKKRTVQELYRQLLASLKNRQAMNNCIGNVDRLRDILCGFSPKRVSARYRGDWQALFKVIKRDVRPRSRMAMSVPQNYWVVFCKGALDGAALLEQYRGASDFYTRAEAAAAKDQSAVELPREIKKQVRGLGFALACDFLKESGLHGFGKPDTHVRKILTSLRFSGPGDLELHSAMQMIAAANKVTPYAVDRALWLIGSNYLLMQPRTNTRDFIALARAKLRR